MLIDEAIYIVFRRVRIDLQDRILIWNLLGITLLKASLLCYLVASDRIEHLTELVVLPNHIAQ